MFIQFIQGKNRTPCIFFSQSIDQIVEQDNEVRIIDLFVESIQVADFGFVLKTTTEGRPAYHLKDLLKLISHFKAEAVENCWKICKFVIDIKT